MIILPAALHRLIVQSAQEAYPEECCGLLIGFHESDDRARVTEIAASANVAPPPRHHRFEVDPALRFTLMRQLRGTGEKVIGHYHSHPDGPARPSADDAAMAYEPDLLWIIIAVAAGTAGELAAFRYDPQARKFGQIPIGREV